MALRSYCLLSLSFPSWRFGFVNFPTHCDSSISSPRAKGGGGWSQYFPIGKAASPYYYTHTHTLPLWPWLMCVACVCVWFAEQCGQRGGRGSEPGGLEGEVPGPGGSAHQVQNADHQDPRADRWQGGQLHSGLTQWPLASGLRPLASSVSFPFSVIVNWRNRWGSIS